MGRKTKVGAQGVKTKEIVYNTLTLGTDNYDDKPDYTPEQGEKIKKKYNWDARDQAILDFVIKHPHATTREMAPMVELSHTSVAARMKKPEFKRRYAEHFADQKQLVSRVQIMGLRRLMQLIMSKDERIALEASRIATQPLLNVATLLVNQKETITYAVQFGENGEVIRNILKAPDAEEQIVSTTYKMITDEEGLINEDA